MKLVKNDLLFPIIQCLYFRICNGMIEKEQVVNYSLFIYAFIG